MKAGNDIVEHGLFGKQPDILERCG